MRVVSLSEFDRALVKICAGQLKGTVDSLSKYIRVEDRLDLSSLPKMVEACDREESQEYKLEDADFDFLKKLFKEVKEWPYAMAKDIVVLNDRLDAAKIEGKGKKAKGSAL